MLGTGTRGCQWSFSKLFVDRGSHTPRISRSIDTDLGTGCSSLLLLLMLFGSPLDFLGTADGRLRPCCVWW